MTAGVGTHYMRYASANALVMVAGLVSFPLLTRMLDNTQYGILGYYDAWVLMAVAIGKLGAQHAILRFYPHEGGQERMRGFLSTLFLVPLLVAGLAWLLLAMGLGVFNRFHDLHQQPVFWLALLAVPMYVFSSQVATLLRATENSALLGATRVGWRWAELVLMVGAVLLLQRSALAAYGGKVAAAVLVIGFYLRWVRVHARCSLADVDRALLRRGMLYGLPLVAHEVIAVAMVAIDRLLIKHVTGDFAMLGIYAIGAGLAMQVHTFMNLTVFEAFAPTANRVYLTQGAEAMRALKARVLVPLTYAAVAIAALMLCFATDVIIALSGPSKAASGPVLAIAGAVCALQPLLLLAGYGLLLETRTTKILALMCAALAVNTGLNVALIPAMGYMGAAYANLASSLLLGVGHCLLVQRSMLQLPDRRTVLTSSAAATVAALLALATARAGWGAGWPRLLVGGGVFAMLYASTTLALDPRLRALAWSQWRARFPLQPRSVP